MHTHITNFILCVVDRAALTCTLTSLGMSHRSRYTHGVWGGATVNTAHGQMTMDSWDAINMNPITPDFPIGAWAGCRFSCMHLHARELALFPFFSPSPSPSPALSPALALALALTLSLSLALSLSLVVG